jgi:hypothetical protein
MADRVKRTWRGKTYTVKSTRPGKKRVTVRPYCRRKPRTFAERYHSNNDLPF